ncbi:hypothetical protein FIA56_08630 [Testudinibacter sp. TR-2022]|uniref:hypothetical protein n=1 Tax=Testudinibacter sp. TR-2022 TaxID=2585029 RepID=UPI00111912B4|nr:hypothetical protein [Testudinibacter sp. TR-2022]TNH06259.1 hypothetical protein FHQ25_12490 [Testudinibacter sp. TR-2022]TNH13043.1 hypothetical protein FIA56_08630 [Testudinibacter sp. TR-2022]TNH20476.1 hypothetical protein FHQ23_01785 [Testudinibacter sp. TR-2022]
MLLLSRIPAWFYIAISIFLLSFFILYLLFGYYTRRLDIQGELILLPHSVVLNSPKAGYINEAMVSTGDLVSKDQPLVKIKLERIIENGDVGINSAHSISSQLKQIDSIIFSLEKSKKITLANIQNQIIQNKKILLDIENPIKEIEKNIDDIYALVTSYRKLHKKGIAS